MPLSGISTAEAGQLKTQAKLVISAAIIRRMGRSSKSDRHRLA
jgi:hypothetical protein